MVACFFPAGVVDNEGVPTDEGLDGFAHTDVVEDGVAEFRFPEMGPVLSSAVGQVNRLEKSF